MKITAMITENKSLNGIEAGKSSVIKEILSRPKGDQEINKSLASSDVHISDRALVFSMIKDAINRLPEIREDKVKSIRNDLLNGEYNVSPEHIVSQLLSEHITDALSGE